MLLAATSTNAIHVVEVIICQVKILTFVLNVQQKDANYAIEMVFVMTA